MHPTLPTPVPHARLAPPLAFAGGPVPRPALTVGLLRTPEERQEIAHLRQYADFRSEYEVDPGMAAVDAVKDAIGLVMAFRLDGEAIATLRVIPTGHGVTLTERWWRGHVAIPEILQPGSWEVGRLVMAPEHRRADLLPRCMTLGLVQLLEEAEVHHMHATCHMAMTRLYRRFGFGIHAQREHGDTRAALIHGPVDAVARALKVAQVQQAAEVHLRQ